MITAWRPSFIRDLRRDWQRWKVSERWLAAILTSVMAVPPLALAIAIH